MSLCPARFESIKGRLLNLFVCLFVFPDRQSVSDACVGLEVKKTWFFEKSSCKVSTLQYLQGGGLYASTLYNSTLYFRPRPLSVLLECRASEI